MQPNGNTSHTIAGAGQESKIKSMKAKPQVKTEVVMKTKFTTCSEDIVMKTEFTTCSVIPVLQ
jgi:hypothetical protein